MIKDTPDFVHHPACADEQNAAQSLTYGISAICLARFTATVS